MTDKDREAFELYAKGNRLFLSGIKHSNGTCQGELTLEAWEAWQAARDHYSPRLTEAEVEKAARALAEIDCRAQAELQKIFNESHEDEVACVNNSWRSYVHGVKVVLRAAGVRFKEEA